MELSAIRTRMHTSSADESCILLFCDGRLFACLVQLDVDLHSDLGGCWFIEATFGSPSSSRTRVFDDLEEAIRSVTEDTFGEPVALESPPIELEGKETHATLPLQMPEILDWH